MKIRLAGFAICIGVVCIAAPPYGYCTIYKYVDANGTPCFSDNLQSIPEQFRGTARIAGAEANEAEPKAARHYMSFEKSAPQPVPASSSSWTRYVPGSFIGRLLFSIAIVVSSVFIYYRVVKAALMQLSGEGKREAFLAASRFALLCVVGITVGLLHAEDAKTLFGRVGGMVHGVQQRSSDRGKRTAEAMKQIKALMNQKENGLPPEEENK